MYAWLASLIVVLPLVHCWRFPVRVALENDVQMALPIKIPLPQYNGTNPPNTFQTTPPFTPIGLSAYNTRDPLAMSTLKNDIGGYVHTAIRLDLTIMASGLNNKQLISHHLRKTGATARQCHQAISVYMETIVTQIDRILLSSEYKLLLEFSAFQQEVSVGYLRQWPMLTSQATEVQDAALSILIKFRKLGRSLGTQNHLTRHLSRLQDTLNDFNAVLDQNTSKVQGERVKKWIFSNIKNDADETVVQNIKKRMNKLIVSVNDAYGHLDYINTAIENLGEGATEILFMEGLSLPFPQSILELGSVSAMLRNEVFCDVESAIN